MFTHAFGRLGEVAALARPVDHEVLCGAIGLASDCGLAVCQYLNIATKALWDKQQGTLVASHKLTLGKWLDTWLW